MSRLEKAVFVCGLCGRSVEAFLSPTICPGCQASFSMQAGGKQLEGVRKLSEYRPLNATRTPTGHEGLDLALSGGIVGGQVVLLAGGKGTGKSTVAMTAAEGMARRVGRASFYVSGEEWGEQMRLLADRLGINASMLYFRPEPFLELFEEDVADLRPALLIVDSLQMLDDTREEGAKVTRRKAAFEKLIKRVRSCRVPLLILSQVNSDGDPSGGTSWGHLADAQLVLEGNKDNRERLLRTEKNRHGDSPLNIPLVMTSRGLVVNR